MTARTRALPACVICGSTREVERHHIGGRRHLAWITVPLCRPHHNLFHLLLERVSVDLTFCADSLERLLRVSRAISVFQCMVQTAIDEIYRKKG
jgi:hypothetical protein